jgi:molybdate transport system ATP-binding protein
MTLQAVIGVDRGVFALDITIEVGDGEVVALLGPNGAGKTTALRAVAGLLPLDRGRIEVGDAVLDDPAAGVFVPPAQRAVGYVPQDHVLFPHLSALDNVGFGLRARGATRASARADAAGWLDRLGLTERASARPAALSGGEAQRVALARALAIEPGVLLLDEPLAALDARTRPGVRAELRRHLATFAGARVLVTHDPVDAAVLADRLVVVEDGRVVQQGTVSAVTRRPASRYVADLVGVNLLQGTAAGDRSVRLASGAELALADRVPGPAVTVAIRPRAVSLHRARPEGSPRNTWAVTVVDVAADHGDDRVRVELDGSVALVAEVTPGAVTELGLAPGAAVWAAVKAVDIECYVA